MTILEPCAAMFLTGAPEISTIETMVDPAARQQTPNQHSRPDTARIGHN
jgi:hypothetical protein